MIIRDFVLRVIVYALVLAGGIWLLSDGIIKPVREVLKRTTEQARTFRVTL